MANSTSTARMKKLRVAHYIAVEGSSGRSNRAQSEAPLKKLKAENARHAVRSVCFHRGRRRPVVAPLESYDDARDEDYSAVVSLVLSVNRP